MLVHACWVRCACCCACSHVFVELQFTIARRPLMDASKGDMTSLEAASLKWDAAYGQKDTTILASLLADNVVVHPGGLGGHTPCAALAFGLPQELKICPFGVMHPKQC